MPLDPHELAGLAVDTARAAGALLRDRPADLGVDAKSTPTDAVTVMDRAAERLIVERLAAVRPGDHVVAEEGGSRPLTSGAPAATDRVTWVVDPLDGTVNYLYGIPQFAVSIAAEVEGVTLAGAVYDVGRDEMYVAVRGQGATCEGRPLRCGRQTDLAMSLVATGFGYAADLRAAQAAVLRHVLPRVRDIRRMGSAALDLCAVARGRVDAFFETGMFPWDWAAGALVAEEAGAVVRGLGGRPPETAMTVAANPDLAAALEAVLVEAGVRPATS